MPLMIGVIAAQVAAAGLGYLRNTKTQARLDNIQKQYESALQQRNFERAAARKREMEKLQEHNDWEAHQLRLQSIEESFSHSIHVDGYGNALQNWPLRVPPFVMKDESIGLFERPELATRSTVALHCILSRSNDSLFNQLVYPRLEHKLSVVLSKNWGANSTHPILYYSGAYKDAGEIGPKIPNLKAQLPHLPVLTITPYIKDEPEGINFCYHISLWGVTKGDSIDNPQLRGEIIELEFTPEGISKHYKRNKTDYSIDEIQSIVIEQVETLSAFIGYVADMYYWSYYSIAPLLPITKSNDCKPLSKQLADAYIKCYREYIADDRKVVTPDYAIIYLAKIKSLFPDDLFQKELRELLNQCLIKRKTIDKSLADEEIFSRNDIFLPQDYFFIREFNKLFQYRNMKKVTQKMKRVTKDNFKLDAQDYTRKRDELLDILQDILKVEGLSDSEITRFQSIRNKCLENQFNITLIGEFQGGKSTTFNAFCDGREISPRGAMTKTSACRITASNLSDKNKKEYSRVYWKNDSQLLQSISTIIESHIVLSEISDRKELSDNLIDSLRLANPAHFKIVSQAVAKEKKRLLNSLHNEALDIVRIAEIILHFYNDPYIRKLKKGNIFSINDISKLAVFPKTWSKHWANEGVSAFRADEIVFAFIGGIDCYIHSKNLARLGCTITDCPGLFTSKWDSKVAFDILPQSDAILYLLGGQKEMGEGDTIALKEIVNKNISCDKIFFAVNTRGSKSTTQNIIDANRNKLINLGFERNSLEIHTFNSLLFFLGEFGQTYLNKQCDEHSVEQFQNLAKQFDYEDESIENLWVEQINDRGSVLKDKKLRNISKLCHESVKTVLSSSSSNELFSSIEKFIIDRKAYSILIESGAEFAKRALDTIATNLKTQEEIAKKSLADCEAEFQESQAALDDFQQHIKRILKTAFPDDVFDSMLEDGFRTIFSNNVETISLNSTVQLYPILKTFAAFTTAGLHAMGYKKDAQAEKLKNLVEPALKQVIEQEMTTSLNVWTASIKSGENQYYHIIERELNRINDSIDAKWDKAVEDCVYIKEYTIRFPSHRLDNIDFKRDVSTARMNESELQDFKKVIISGVIDDVILYIKAWIVASIVFIVLDALFTMGVAIIIGVIVQVIMLIKGEDDRDTITSKDQLSKKELKLYDALYYKLLEVNNNPEAIDKIKSGLAMITKFVSSTYLGCYEKSMENQKQALLEEIERTRILKKESLENQNNLAKNAKIKRECHILPLRERLRLLIESLTHA